MTTTNRSHANCDHPATKAGRAKCRKARASVAQGLLAELDKIIESYFNEQGSCEEIAAKLSDLAYATRSESLLAAANGYYTEELDMEEIISLATKAKMEIR